MRSVGDDSNVWGTAQWSGVAGSPPFLGTWAAAAGDRAAVLEDDPDPSEGRVIVPGVGLRFVVQAFNPTAEPDSVWGTALWGSGHWNAAAGAWVDISQRVRGVTWDQGPDEPDEEVPPGTATLVLANLDAALSPWASTGDFIASGDRPWLSEGTLVRWGVIDPDATPALDPFNAFFTGRVETVEEGSESGVDAWVTLTLTELTTELAAYSGEVRFLDGQTTSQALVAVLAAIDWPYQQGIRVPSEEALIQAATLGGYQDAQYASSVLETLSAGKHWAIQSDGRGRVQAARRGIADTDSGLTFSNNPVAGELPISVDGIAPFAGTDRLLNYATAQSITGSPQRVQDAGSTTKFGTVSDTYGFPREDLLLRTDADVLALGQRVVSLYAFDSVGIDAVEVNIDLDPEALAVALTRLASVGREALGFRVRWEHPSGDVLEQYVILHHATHAIVPLDADGQLHWTATLSVRIARTAAA